jgi:predicted porin
MRQPLRNITYDIRDSQLHMHRKGYGMLQESRDFCLPSYAHGPGAVYLGFHRAQWADVQVDIRAYSLSARYIFSPAAYFAVGYAFLDDATAQGNDASEYSTLFNYSLSKRTNFYGAISFLDNRKKSRKTLAGAVSVGIPLAYAGANAKAVQLGVAHKF